MDWGIGHYESTAARLAPAAELLVEVAAPTAGERVVDVGCGTGNAALLAAVRGAHVTGVDPAPRLLERRASEPAATARASSAGTRPRFRCQTQAQTSCCRSSV